MPLDVVNRRNSGTLCEAEIIDKYGITHAHAVKGVTAKWRHFYARFGGINRKGRVQHGKSPALATYGYRQQSAQLEAFPLVFLKQRSVITNIELTVFTKIARITQTINGFNELAAKKIENVWYVEISHRLLPLLGLLRPRCAEFSVSLAADCNRQCMAGGFIVRAIVGTAVEGMVVSDGLNFFDDLIEKLSGV